MTSCSQHESSDSNGWKNFPRPDEAGEAIIKADNRLTKTVTVAGGGDPGSTSTVVYTNNALNQMLGYTECIAGVSPATNTVTFAYDPNGARTNKTVYGSGLPEPAVTKYTYDSLGRLKAEDYGAYSWTNEYDLAGNMTSFGFSYGAGNRLDSWFGQGSAQYDAAGNTTNLVSGAGAQWSLQWDERYRLTSVEGRNGSPQPSVSYTHEVLGRRTSRTRTAGVSPAEVEQYVYSGNQVAADLDASGNVLRTYTWGPGIDNLLSLTVWSGGSGSTPTATYYPLKDHQNSVLALTHESGTIAESYEYDAWGKVLSIKDGSGTVLSQSAIGNRYLWQGREYDSDTGLYYFRARWYSPETGRWLSKDPIGISGGLNLYVFCENNPVNFIDPLGLTLKGAVAAVLVEIANYVNPGGAPPIPTVPPAIEAKSTEEIIKKIAENSAKVASTTALILILVLTPQTAGSAEIPRDPIDLTFPSFPPPKPGDPGFIGPIQPSTQKK